MSDYQVTYEETSTYRQGHELRSKRKLGSPVRIFTTLMLKDIDLGELPTKYRFCHTCQCHVSLTNRHCQECQTCPAKNGGLYRHCYECRRCIKTSWRHCQTCQRCTLPDHHCSTSATDEAASYK